MDRLKVNQVEAAQLFEIMAGRDPLLNVSYVKLFEKVSNVLLKNNPTKMDRYTAALCLRIMLIMK